MSVSNILRLAVLWTLSLIYSCVVVVIWLAKILTNPRMFLTCKKRLVRPKCLDDEEFKHSYIRLKNLRMHYVSTGQEGKPLMLCLHGFPEFWYSWRHQLREFKDDYRVVAVDFRGYNETETTQGIHGYTLGKLCEDIKQLVEVLGYDDFLLVGHDKGGAIAWCFAASFPECVKKLIIIQGPNPSVFMEYYKTHVNQFFKSWYTFFYQMPILPEFDFYFGDCRFISESYEPLIQKGVMTEEDVEAYKYAFRNSVTGPIDFYRASFRLKPGLKRETNQRYTMPTLVIWADKDPHLRVELGQRSAALADNCTYKVIPDAGHFLQQECPKEVIAIMRKWLNTSE